MVRKLEAGLCCKSTRLSFQPGIRVLYFGKTGRIYVIPTPLLIGGCFYVSESLGLFCVSESRGNLLAQKLEAVLCFRRLARQ